MASTTSPRLRIVIADDHRLVLSALGRELDSAGFIVCGEATTGADALELVLATRPDLALLDVQMPEGRGDEVASVLAREAPEVKVVLLTASPSDDGALAAVRAGAVGYLDKTIATRTLVHVLQDVGRGEGSFPRRLMPSLVRELRTAPGRWQA